MSRAHDRESVTKIAYAHRDSMVGFAFGMLRDWSAAEDIVHEAILVIFDRWERYRSEEAILPWLRGIVRKKCLKVISTRSRETASENDTLDFLLQQRLEESWGEDLHRHELSRRISALRGCLGELPERSQQLLNDFYTQQKPGDLLARYPDIPQNTIWSRVHRLRKRLETCMHERLGEQPEPQSGSAADPSILDALDDHFSGGTDRDSRIVLEHFLRSDRAAGAIVRNFVIDWTAAAISSGQTLGIWQASAHAHAAPDAVAAPFEVAHPTSTTVTFAVPSGSSSQPPVRSAPSKSITGTSAAAPVEEIFAEDHPQPPPSPLRWLRSTGGATRAAAALVALAAAAYLVAGLMDRNSSPVASMTSDVGWFEIRSGKSKDVSRITPGTQVAIHPGDTISIPNRTWAELSYFDEPTSMSISPGTRLTVRKNPLLGAPEKRFILHTGSVAADVAPQPESCPLTIETPIALATVIGTAFNLSTDARSSLLEVEHGEVVLASVDGQTHTSVGTGQSAAILQAAGDGHPLREFQYYYEAENARWGGTPQGQSPAEVRNNHDGYKGTGYVDFESGFIEWTLVVPTAGEYTATIRYSLGIDPETNHQRPIDIDLNGNPVQRGAELAPTARWGDWQEHQIGLELVEGANTLRLTSTSSRSPGIDVLTLRSGNALSKPNQQVN